MKACHFSWSNQLTPQPVFSWDKIDLIIIVIIIISDLINSLPPVLYMKIISISTCVKKIHSQSFYFFFIHMLFWIVVLTLLTFTTIKITPRTILSGWFGRTQNTETGVQKFLIIVINVQISLNKSCPFWRKILRADTGVVCWVIPGVPQCWVF